jgi:ABC-type histidine transport system ATPase subunit
MKLQNMNIKHEHDEFDAYRVLKGLSWSNDATKILAALSSSNSPNYRLRFNSIRLLLKMSS